MELREAYRILELPVGASEDKVRDARKLLAKVWHPDRYANDPELQKKAEQKLADINAAFEVLRSAKFPPSPSADQPRPERPPAAAAPAPAPAPPPAPSPPAVPPPLIQAGAPPGAKSPITFEPRNSMRWSTILLIVSALAVGTYFAIGGSGSQSRAGAVDEPPYAARAIEPPRRDEQLPPAVPVPPAAPGDDPPLEALPGGGSQNGAELAAPEPEQPTGWFGLGSTREQVRAVQGPPSGVSTVNTTVSSSVRTQRWSRSFSSNSRTSAEAELEEPGGTLNLGSAREQARELQGLRTSSSTTRTEAWSYGASTVDFDPERGTVIGWWQVDGQLKVRLVPRDAAVAAKARAAGGFAKGAAKDEVIALHGTPSRISQGAHETWTYGNATQVDFDDAGKVIGWSEADVKLKLR